MMNTAFLVFSSLIAGIAIFGAIRAGRRLHFITSTPTTPIADLQPGLAEIKGTVTLLSKQPALLSPYSRKQCVYYEFEVTEHFNRGSKTIIRDKKRIQFAVQDSTGVVDIDPDGADVLLNMDIHTSTKKYDKEASPEVEELLNRYGKSSKGLTSEKFSTFTEHSLEPGDEVYVLGEVGGASDKCMRFAKGAAPYIISDKGELSLVGEYRLAVFRSSVLAVLGVSLMLYAILL